MPSKMEEKRQSFAPDKNKKLDRRIIKTKQTLRSTLMRILQDTSIDNLTVQDLCLEADVNRMTFYKHYEDKYALLSDCLFEFSRQINANLLKTRSLDCTPAQYCVSVLDELITFCSANGSFIKTALFHGNTASLNIISDSLRTIFSTLLKSLMKDENDPSIPYLASILSGSVGGVLRYAVKSEGAFSKEALKENIAPIINDIVTSCPRIKSEEEFTESLKAQGVGKRKRGRKKKECTL